MEEKSRIMASHTLSTAVTMISTGKKAGAYIGERVRGIDVNQFRALEQRQAPNGLVHVAGGVPIPHHQWNVASRERTLQAPELQRSLEAVVEAYEAGVDPVQHRLVRFGHATDDFDTELLHGADK